jgi:1-acyl-sn-glycerol-3-phosphate acyltransferase
MLVLLWSAGVRPRVLVKKELYRGPLGWLFDATGGIPVDRKHPAGWWTNWRGGPRR